MTTENIFSGLKVVDLSSFIAGPAAAVILSDYGADVIKVEPPTGDTWRIGYKLPPQPRSHDNYPWHLNNRNKRGMALDLKSPKAAEILERLVKWADVLIVNTPHPARKKLKLEYRGRRPVESPDWFMRTSLVTAKKDLTPAFQDLDITAYWARSGLLSLTRDAGAPPTLPPSGSGDHATAVTLFSAIVTALYRRERTGKGSYVTTSLLAAGVWSCGVFVQGALCDAAFFPLHDRLKPPNALINMYRTSDDIWFVLVLTPDKWPALAKGIGRPELPTDPRFADPVKLAANSAELTAILDEVFRSQPISHWQEILEQSHLTFGIVHSPSEVVKDPQLEANGIVVPIEGAGGNLKLTISSPIQVHDVAKVPAKRAPEIGEHNEEVLKELGFTGDDIDGLRESGAIPHVSPEPVAPGGAR